MASIFFRPHCVNSLCTIDVIWRHATWWPLIQITAVIHSITGTEADLMLFRLPKTNCKDIRIENTDFNSRRYDWKCHLQSVSLSVVPCRVKGNISVWFQRKKPPLGTHLNCGGVVRKMKWGRVFLGSPDIPPEVGDFYGACQCYLCKQWQKWHPV